MFSSDSNIFLENSEANTRMREYALVLGELHVIGTAEKDVRPKRVKNLFLHPVSKAHRITHLFRMFFRARSLCRAHRFDAVTVQAPDEMGAVGFCISRIFAIPFQIQIHTDIFSPWYRRASLKERIRYLLACFLIPKARSVRVVSWRIKNSLLLRKKCDARRIVTLPIFTDISKFFTAQKNPEIETRLKEYEFKIVAVGRFMDKEKNFSMLIDIMRSFVKICPDALLMIVGDGPDRENYKLQIKNYTLDKNIVLESWRSDLPSFYKSFDLFLQPSWYEGWGRTAVEAMAAGIPVIMTDVGLAGEVVKNGENGIVIPVGNVSAMQEAVERLYRDPAFRARIREAGKKTAQSLAPATKEEYFTAYKKALAQCVSTYENSTPKSLFPRK